MLEIKTICLGPVNCFLIKSDAGFALVDAGYPGDCFKLEKELENEGCLPGNLKLIVITHGDGDHTGGASYIRGKYNSIIAMNKSDSAMAESFEEKTNRIKNRKARGLISKIKWEISLYVSSLESVREKAKAAFAGFKPDLYLEDGQRLDRYGINAKVVYVPGHTKGSIGILTDNNDLIAGDIFNNYRKPAPCFQGEDLEEIDISVEKLKALNIGIVYPGHGKPFKMKDLL